MNHMIIYDIFFCKGMSIHLEAILRFTSAPGFESSQLSLCPALCLVGDDFLNFTGKVTRQSLNEVNRSSLASEAGPQELSRNGMRED